MDKKKEAQAIPSFLLDKLWEAYSLNDDRRRKSFYYLFSTMIVLGLFFLTKEQTPELPFFNIKVDSFIALTLAPSIILILTVRYFYLCAHSISTYIRYIDHFCETYKDELNELQYSFIELHAFFKKRDLTENLNIYMFPMIGDTEWDVVVNKVLKRIVYPLANAAVLLFAIAPIASYLVMVFLFGSTFSHYISASIGIPILLFYVFAGILLVASPFYFYNRAREARRIFKEKTMRTTI